MFLCEYKQYICSNIFKYHVLSHVDIMKDITEYKITCITIYSKYIIAYYYCCIIKYVKSGKSLYIIQYIVIY